VLVKTKDLHELLYNTILFTARKSAAGPTIQLNLKEGFLYGRATNDIDCIETRMAVGNDWALEWTEYISLDSAKSAEKFLRDVSDEDVNLVMSDSPEFTLCIDTDDEHYDINCEEDSLPMIWEDTRRLLAQQPVPTFFPEEYPVFAVAPERLRKYTLVKPGNYPIDFLVVDDLLYWKAGPNNHGVLAALDRIRIKDKFEKEALW